MTINDYFDDAYLYTDTLDLSDFISECVCDALDTQLTYTNDIIDLWKDIDSPEPSELGMSVHDSIVFAVHEHYLSEDWTADVEDAQLEFASHLHDRANTVSWLSCDHDKGETLESLDDIMAGTVDVEDAHVTLIEIRDIIEELA